MVDFSFLRIPKEIVSVSSRVKMRKSCMCVREQHRERKENEGRVAPAELGHWLLEGTMLPPPQPGMKAPCL